MKKATIAEVYAVATILQIMAEEQPPPFPYDGAHKMLLGPTYAEEAFVLNEVISTLKDALKTAKAKAKVRKRLGFIDLDIRDEFNHVNGIKNVEL